MLQDFNKLICSGKSPEYIARHIDMEDGVVLRCYAGADMSGDEEDYYEEFIFADQVNTYDNPDVGDVFCEHTETRESSSGERIKISRWHKLPIDENTRKNNIERLNKNPVRMFEDA